MKEVRVVELPLTIEQGDIDLLGHVNNITYIRWVQDAALAGWMAGSTPDDRAALAWIVLRHEIDYKKAALPSDRLIARTWVGAASLLRFERFTQVLRATDRMLLAMARTLWCPIDRRTGTPTRVSPAVREEFSNGVLAE